ncbi:MAG: ABC transporter permease [Lachnospiraceae bacterium]|nr:ABC transporter permease [Lachnospiraceae bacterium]
MRKVRNNQAVKRLARKSFQASRTRNSIAAIAIGLTAVLFTAVFTIGIGIVEDTQKSSMLQAGGDAHGAIKDLTQEQYEILAQHPSIRECGRDIVMAHAVENPEFLKRHVEIHYLDENLYPHWFVEILEGKKPEAAHEILMDQKSMELLGLEAKAGTQVTLKIQVHPGREAVERTFTVSGVIKSAEAMKVGFVFVSEAYRQTYGEELVAGPEDVFSDTGKISMHVIFSNSRGIQGKLNKIITDSGFSLEEGSPDYIGSNANWAYLSDGAESDPMTILSMGAAMLLIVVTGYLIIYNIFQISVIRDIRYYGLLKTIGTTGRQIKRILRRQAVRLFFLGTPGGLIVGYVAGNILLPFVASVGTGRDRGEILVSVHPWIFLGAALFTLVTVWISQWKPGRIAAKVSPVEALRYTEHGKEHKKPKKTTDGGKLPRMAFSNLGRNKGRTLVVLCSLSLTLVLMNTFYTIASSVDRNGFLSKMILSEGIIGNAQLWNYNYFITDEETAQVVSLSESFIAACEEQESFSEGGRIYMHQAGGYMPVESWEIPDYIPTNEEGVPGNWYPDGFYPFSGYEEGVYTASIYGIEPFVLSKMTVVEGETDPRVIWEKLKTGNYLLYSVQVDDNNFIMENKRKHHAGDKITLTYRDGGPTKEYEILSVVKEHSYSLTNRIANEFSYYITAEDFKKYLSDAFLMSYLFDVKEGQEAAMEEFLKTYTEEEEPLMSFESRTTYEGNFQEMLGTLTLVGIALTAVIGIIGLLNFTNVILTSMTARKREFAMMEAIGMTKRQLVGMLTAEGLYYAAFTILCSLMVATLFSLTVVRAIGDGIWLIQYRFTLLPVFLASPVLLLLGVLLPRVVYRFRGKKSIVEEIRE